LNVLTIVSTSTFVKSDFERHTTAILSWTIVKVALEVHMTTIPISTFIKSLTKSETALPLTHYLHRIACHFHKIDAPLHRTLHHQARMPHTVALSRCTTRSVCVAASVRTTELVRAAQLLFYERLHHGPPLLVYYKKNHF